MFVRRVDVSLRDSIQRESCVTGANAMSASLDGSGPGSLAVRTKRSRAGLKSFPIQSGFHRDAGGTPMESGSEILRGPVRRSSSDAIAVRQLSAAIFRSASVIVTCASFSASTKVPGETGGPAPGPVLNAGGAPGVSGVDDVDAADVLAADDDAPFCSSLRQLAAMPSKPSGAVMRNCRRVFTSARLKEG